VRDLMFIRNTPWKAGHGSIEQRASASIERFLAVIERNRSMWLTRSAPAATAETRISNRSQKPTK